MVKSIADLYGLDEKALAKEYGVDDLIEGRRRYLQIKEVEND